MKDERYVVIVASQADRLSYAVSSALRQRDIQILWIYPANLANQHVSIVGDTFTIEQEPVGAILFRAPTEASFSNGFVAADRSFSDTETRALWLAAMHLDSILAINRYDAEAWFGSVGWVRWRQMLKEANVPVAPFAFGDTSDEKYGFWYPYAGAHYQPAPNHITRSMLGTALSTDAPEQIYLAVCGHIVGGAAQPAAAEAARLLNEAGINIAAIATDKNGQVITVDTLPAVEKADLINKSAEILIEFIYEHLRTW